MPTGNSQGFARIAVGWDGSRGAARAVSDALPFLRQAQAVEIVTDLGEKTLSDVASPEGLRDHLARHGIGTQAHVEPAGQGDAGAALLRRAEQSGADLLVMGAYGQSKLREFVLGGATRIILANARTAVLMSH